MEKVRADRPARNIQRIVKQIAIAAVSGLALAACATPAAPPTPTQVPSSGSWEDIVSAAATEGSVNVYATMQQPLIDAIVTAFNEEYPDIQVNVSRADGGTMTARVATELEAGTQSADVVQLADSILFTDLADKFVGSSDFAVMPNLEGVPDDLVGDSFVRNGGSPLLISYNSTLVSEPSDEWSELGDWDDIDKLALADPRANSTFAAWWLFMRDQVGDDAVKELAGQASGWFDSASAAPQQLAAGSVGALAMSAASWSLALRTEGAPIELVSPSPTLAVTYSFAVPENAPHSNAALVFLDFMLSAAGATALCSNGDGYLPFVHTDIQGCEPLDVTDTAFVDEYNLQATDAAKAETLKLVGLQ